MNIEPITITTLCKSLSDVNLQGILNEFVSPENSKYDRPRIAFLGCFFYLSMSDQRQLCKSLGFEYISDIPLGTANEDQLAKLTSKWKEITSNFTKLIVIGDAYEFKFNDVKESLMKTYKKDDEPIFAKYDIPIVMESEVIKLHKQYPDITKNTIWTDEYI